MIKKIVFASHNQGKIKEMKELLEPFGVEVVSAAELNLGDIEETGTTFEENASRADFRTETVIGITDDFELATSRRVVRSGEASIKEKGL